MGNLIDFKRPDGSTCKGYLAEAGKGKPGIVVIQEWWGLNDQICGVADRFARQGYNALAPDLYKGRVTQKPAKIKVPLQGHFANQDDWCTPAAVDGLEKTMKGAGQSPEIFRYDAAHAFSNERSEAYDVKSANAAWERMLEFLKKHL